MATLATTDKAPIVDENSVQLGTVGQELYHITSDDPTIASVDWVNWLPWVTAHAAGSVTISGVRLVDGATATLEVTVTEPTLGTFVMLLGTAVAK